ncbi:DNA-binding protein [Blautia wexlerae]|uniref:helix-turn-helix domain-containing protein n=1 Tax=Blautia wexlerae TaxID=418240 RepID=UPI001371CF80|nr:helix-turn-helix domain-containing protein [Blautia wexlerae]MZT59957.1 DNA-binding protein [Blautia wexlerae]
MNDKKRLNSYEDLPLVLDVADIQRIMGISRASAYELVHTPGFPLIKVSKIAFFEWMAKGSETVPGSDK